MHTTEQYSVIKNDMEEILLTSYIKYEEKVLKISSFVKKKKFVSLAKAQQDMCRLLIQSFRSNLIIFVSLFLFHSFY